MIEHNPKHQGFADRLNEAMRAHDVNVIALKRYVGVTYEMARRYTLGTAMPRDDKMTAIARCLDTDPAWLRFGTLRQSEPAQPPATKMKKERLSARELVLLRRAAEDAIHAANPRYGPFIDAVANPLMILKLVDMAMLNIQP